MVELPRVKLAVLEVPTAVAVLRYLAVRFAEHPWREEYPALAALSDRLEARPSFAATTPVPQNIVEAVV